MEEEKGIVIACKHLSEERRATKRVILVQLIYEEFERMIDCQSEASSSTPYICKWDSSVLIKRYKQPSCNPLDCQECKSDIINYFTSVIAHPNPNGVLADLCTQLDDYIHQGIPSPLVRQRLSAAAAICKLGTYMMDIVRDENPVVELTCYHISNYTERHYLPQGQGSDSREWCVTWLGDCNPQPTHPRLCDLNLDKVDGQSLDGIDFTCPICLTDEVNKSVDAQVDLEDDDLVVALPCRHIFHKSCISLWLERANCCPQCRFQLPNVCVAWGTHQISSLENMNLVSRFVSQPGVNLFV
ncbi:hypothetical protein RND81_06G041000 [Saponaria officinalis]|uniref:RING-type E3 ubiquitin transferase n=1 Tax=Saponaria officinalis TaxID=3572 RepID=A0AAW1K9I1_SAPOF